MTHTAPVTQYSVSGVRPREGRVRLRDGGRFLGYQAGIAVVVDLLWVVVFASYLLAVRRMAMAKLKVRIPSRNSVTQAITRGVGALRVNTSSGTIALAAIQASANDSAP